LYLLLVVDGLVCVKQAVKSARRQLPSGTLLLGDCDAHVFGYTALILVVLVLEVFVLSYIICICYLKGINYLLRGR
jgi:hypothetical protein